MKQRLAILGSTGSIGVQTLDIVRETPSLFEVRVLTANRNWSGSRHRHGNSTRTRQSSPTNAITGSCAMRWPAPT